jgi:hypothetical protein
MDSVNSAGVVVMTWHHHQWWCDCVGMVGGAEPCECHRPAQRGHQGIATVCGTQPEQDLHLRTQPGVADCGDPDQERLGIGTQAAELLLSMGFGRGPRPGCGRGPS